MKTINKILLIIFAGALITFSSCYVETRHGGNNHRQRQEMHQPHNNSVDVDIQVPNPPRMHKPPRPPRPPRPHR